MPQMLDPNFNGALTYICEHNEQGAMGIIINQPIQLKLSELLDQFELTLVENDHPVLAGGPVERERGFILHDDDSGKWESHLAISSSLSLTSSKDILEAISKDKGPSNFLVVLGYAGWSEGQLERELAENTWLCCPSSSDIIFHPKNEEKLNLAMRAIGIDPSQLNGQIGHA